MNKKSVLLSILLVVSGFVQYSVGVFKASERPSYQALSDIERLFPRTQEDIKKRRSKALSQTAHDVAHIVSLRGSDLTFDRTFRALDRDLERFSIVLNSFTVLMNVSQDKEIRAAVTKAVSRMNDFRIDSIELNQNLYYSLKVCALDLFYTIQPHGLTNQEIGARYVDEVLSKGSSEDPETLLTRFLGRGLSSDAFCKDCGLLEGCL